MIFLKKILDLTKILLIAFIFSLVIDFFLGSKILKYFDKRLIFKKSGFSGFPGKVKINNKFIKKAENLVNLKINIKTNPNYYDKYNFYRDLSWKVKNVAGFLNYVVKKKLIKMH